MLIFFYFILEILQRLFHLQSPCHFVKRTVELIYISNRLHIIHLWQVVNLLDTLKNSIESPPVAVR